MYKTYKVRIYPNSYQKSSIENIFISQRLIYNHYLSMLKSKKIDEKFKIEIDDTILNNYPILKKVDKDILLNTLAKLKTNIKNKNIDNILYKTKHQKNSYIVKDKVIIDNNKIIIPDIGCIRFKYKTNIKGKIIYIIIMRETNCNYYVSILSSFKEPKKVKPKNIVGIDIGIKNLLTLSDGNVVSKNKNTTKIQKRINLNQRKLSKKQRHSKNYYKQLKHLNKYYWKLEQCRKHYINNITTEIVNNYDIIVCESLNINNMLKGNITKKILNSSFDEIIKQLKYKCQSNGKYFYQTDNYFKSTQICSVCGAINEIYKNINYRLFICKNCGNTMDRDLNASINIMFEGLNKHFKLI
ncbi:MAG: transposase, partial [Bacilli bacterium]|nr:transposase [Bacilli bacterium]